MATIFKRTPEQLSERRIDPWHYQPRFERQINKIKDNLSALPLEVVIDSKRGVASGATPLGANYLEKGRVKFYRTSEVEEMFLQAEEAVFINDEDDEKLKRSRLVDGDVLLTITGAKFGKSAVVSAKHLPANISQHSVRFKPDPKKVDAYFLVAYLNSKTGQVAIWKEAYGATRPAIDFPSVRSLAVPKVLPLAQKYIGDKVRQAEQLRAWAKRLEGMADRKIKDLFHFNLVDSLTLKPRRMKQQVLSAVSLAPEFARAADSQMTFRNSSKLSNFISKCKCGDPIKSEDRVPGPYFYYGASGPIDTHTEFNFNGKYLIIAQDGSIGCANVADGKFWANNHVWVLKVKDEYDIESICRFLDKHFPCWKGVTTGSVVPKVTSENLLNILIPIDIAKNREIGSKLRLAVTTAAYAKKLTASAKTLVESLIEGQLTEQQLIQAQQALEDGDSSFDQAILSKLSAEGYAIEGATPLFSDVDELYSLLEEAAQAEAEE